MKTIEELKIGDKVRNRVSCNKGIVRGLFTKDLVEVRVDRGNANPYNTFWKIENIELVSKKI